MEKGTAYFISNKYNYQKKFLVALEQGNIKYIKSLVKRGKLIFMDVDVARNKCGCVSHAVIDSK